MLIGIDASRATAAQRTGTENYSLYLIRALVQRGSAHRFRLYLNGPAPDGLLPAGARVEQCLIPFPRLWTHLRLGWEVLRDPPDVLFVPAHVLPLLGPHRAVATVHDLGYVYYPQMHPVVQRHYLAWATRWNAHRAARLIVDSRATRDDLARLYHVSPAKMVVAYPAGAEGLAPVRDAARLAGVRARYGTGERYFLYVGTLHPRKNIETLLRAFAHLLARGELEADIRLVLAGKPGWLSEGILQLARRADLAERVVLPGYISPEDLPALLSGALAFVLPSWYEGFGLPVLEAMACETPVICSNVSSLPEVAGDAALTFAPDQMESLAQAMLRLSRDETLRAELVWRGRARARAFTWAHCADKVLSALEAVGRHGAPGR